MRRTVTAVAALIASVAMPVAAAAAPAAAHHRRTTYTVTSTTNAGPTPHFPAFDPTTGHVVVSKVSSNTITDLEISTGPGRRRSVCRLRAGRLPVEHDRHPRHRHARLPTRR